MNGIFPADGLAANRTLWDARAQAHGTTPNDVLYDVDSFLAGRQTLFGIELELAGDVAGKDVLHLQCHFGMDTLNWARLGARVTGVDFSSTAIGRARELAELAGLTADFIEADTQNLPSGLAGRFDLVIATYGVLCWIGDLEAWMRGAAMALRPGGTLVLVDLHPAYQILASYEPLVADRPYGGGQPQREVVKSTYADPDLPMTAQEVVQYPHSVGEIVTAAAGSGLIIDWLGEHTEADFPGSRILPEEPDGTRRFPFGDTYLPILYSLRARSPRATTA
ncbi:class I SAM-dependent methyltransferase [Nonomuraea sp. NPDC059007]|uniref:class I SAM-dependent methyltransferase n=1 Tax=Nonomuraea sp. NPDC059007 TaxID=3346692 RepID=UPI0036BDC338